jgi:hypothetical protein
VQGPPSHAAGLFNLIIRPNFRRYSDIYPPALQVAYHAAVFSRQSPHIQQLTLAISHELWLVIAQGKPATFIDRMVCANFCPSAFFAAFRSSNRPGPRSEKEFAHAPRRDHRNGAGFQPRQ